MKWAGRRANAGCSVLAMLNATDEATYDPALPFPEVAGISRSVERYREQWIASRWAHRPAWLERQRERGPWGGYRDAVGGQERRCWPRERGQLRAEGLTQQAIASELEVHRTTVYRMLHEANTINAPPGAIVRSEQIRS